MNEEPTETKPSTAFRNIVVAVALLAGAASVYVLFIM